MPGIGESRPLAGWAAQLSDRRTIIRIVIAIALALPLLWQLGGAPLFDVDEGAFSEATREMLSSGDWGHTTLNGAPRFDKPIGIYWLQAASVQVFGLNEFALRLPSALAIWAMGLALAAFASRRWGDRAGFAAGMIAVTSLGYQAIGRAATADGLLNLLIVLAGLDMWRYIESGTKTPLRRAYAWVGLGLLVKGPVAIVVPGAAFALWCASRLDWRALVRAAIDPVGWALMLAIAVPWYAYELHRDGMAFVDGFLMRHNVERFTGTLQNHGGTPLYYLVVAPLLSMPWAPLLVAVVARSRSLWRDPLARYLLVWGAFVFVFFSLSGTKLPHYMLYGYGPLALLMGRELAQSGPRLVRWVLGVASAWIGVAAALPWVLMHFAGSIRDPFYRALIGGAAAPELAPPLLAVAAVFAILVPWPRRESADSAIVPRTAALAGVLSALLAAWLLPWAGDVAQGPVRRAAAAANAHGGTAAQWRVHLPSFAVYMQREAPLREPRDDEMALMRADRVPPGDDGRPRLFEERGIVLLGPKGEKH
jgi:4-amino-4-deoxy-L-arabinose transferase-like glycosyltransferase